MSDTSQAQATRRRRFQRDEGATLVEFAIIAPILFLLIFGIIEFGWAFGQHLDVRHGAREGSRLVAVNHGMDVEPTPPTGATQSQAIVNEICNRMDLPGTPTVELALGADGDADGKLGETGDFAEVTVTNPLSTITGFLDFALGGITLESTVQTRIERGTLDAFDDELVTWAPGTYSCT